MSAPNELCTAGAHGAVALVSPMIVLSVSADTVKLV